LAGDQERLHVERGSSWHCQRTCAATKRRARSETWSGPRVTFDRLRIPSWILGASKSSLAIWVILARVTPTRWAASAQLRISPARIIPSILWARARRRVTRGTRLAGIETGSVL